MRATMVEMLIWGAGALVIGGYMLVALVKPERF
ncbi:MAG: potassium-transporting ATPase subunit F [Caulobacterales bacterium]|nr:potassium-transporting ATPase subunit F [Caulobacterales bacterium]